jgi:hypothetical protein
MNDREIQEVFQRLALSEKELPEYNDPYTFTQNMKECSVLKYEDVTYSSGTASLEGDADA